MLASLWRDMRHAARSLSRARGFTVVCVVSLGIGMVPVIAVPYAARIVNMPPSGVKTDGLVELVLASRGSPAGNNWSYPDFQDLRAAGTGLDIFGWVHGPTEVRLGGAGEETMTGDAMYVSANYFNVLGVRLARGRGFDAETDDGPGAQPVVVVGYDFWRNTLAGDPDIIGKPLILDGTPHTVVGIAPDQFQGHLVLEGRSLFLPLERHPRLRAGSDAAGTRDDRATAWVHLHGRLAPGTGLQQASAAVAAVTARLARQHPSTNEFRTGSALPYDPLGYLDRPRFTLLAVVGLTLTGSVLLVVCLNIGGMMQARSAMRERELSIRQAVGATRGRLVQLLLSEALVLAGLGSVLASVVLFNVPPLLSWWADRPLPLPVQQALRVDPSIIAVCIGLCVLTSVVFGLMPAARFSRPTIISSLKDDAGVGGFRAGRMRRVTAALQIAIAVPLLVLSWRSLDSFRVTATSTLGFDADLLYAAPLKFDAAVDDRAGSAIRAARGNLEDASGVVSVTVADGLPLDFSGRTLRISLDAPEVALPPLSVHVTRVGDGYLQTMGIPLLRGRGLTDADVAGTERVTVISKAAADRLFPGADPASAIGRRVTVESDDPGPRSLTIVGVTGDFPTSQMSTRREQLLVPLAQDASPKVFLIARSAPGEPAVKMTTALENAVRGLGPEVNRRLSNGDGLAYSSIVTGTWLRKNSMRDFLVQSAVAAVAGGVVLGLAALGIYGVVGLMVAARTREIAVRLALGASRRRVLGMIVFDVVKLVAPGVVLGLVLTLVFVRVNGDNLGIPLSTLQPLSYLAGAAVAVAVAIIAGLAPARRAASIQPMVAMRST